MRDEPLSRLEAREEALAQIRTAIADLQHVPAPALDGDKHELLQISEDHLRSLEAALTNEVNLLREADDAQRD